jgi:hypothetical protein
MQQDYLAAPEPWAAAEKWGANTMDMANCLLELRARVEALEGLHSYKIGKAEPIENWGKGHTLVNPKPPSLKEQAHWRPSMTDPYRAMCAELVDAIFTPNPYNWEDSLYEAANRARALLAQPEPEDRSQISDGCHTFAELYEHRHGLTLALMKAMPRHFWFSQRHHDGELCFGEGKWFIIGAELPDSGEITYHLPNRLWGLAQLTGATELEHGPTWDGHTAGDVVHRLKAWAACPARAQPEPAPVAVSERLPGPEDCTAQGRCWVFYRGFATWTLEKPLGQDGKHTGYTHWLPANALPTPPKTQP